MNFEELLIIKNKKKAKLHYKNIALQGNLSLIHI